MPRPRPRALVARLALSAGLGLALGLLASPPAARAQDPPPAPKDDLDRLLETLDKKGGDAPAPADAKKDEAKKDEAKKDDAKKGEGKTSDAKKGEAKPAPGAEKDEPKKKKPVEVDKDLDDLLGKLGTSADTPDAKGKPEPAGAGGEGPTPPPMPGGPGGDGPKDRPEAKKGGRPGTVAPDLKDIDEHIAELAGKPKKKKPQDQQGQGGGAMADAIKQMDDVEKRLTKTDTGEATRDEQKQIVKKLDSILQEMRRQQGQPQPGRPQKNSKPGEQPGGDQDAPNPDGKGVGLQKPPPPPTPKAMMGDDKNPWGNLPASMRQDMANIAKEGMLEGKRSLVERYFLTILKKSTAKGE